MIRRLIILLLIVGCGFAREYIAIIDFEGISVSEADAKALTQRLTSEMIALEVYQVLERSEMKRLLSEQKFQYSGCVNLKCAVEIGKMIGAKYMVVGSVSKVGYTYAIDSRLIDVETGESNISASFSDDNKIDNLLNKGMKSIAYQLCEMPLKNIGQTLVKNTFSNTTINPSYKKKINNKQYQYWKYITMNTMFWGGIGWGMATAEYATSTYGWFDENDVRYTTADGDLFYDLDLTLRTVTKVDSSMKKQNEIATTVVGVSTVWFLLDLIIKNQPSKSFSTDFNPQINSYNLTYTFKLPN